MFVDACAIISLMAGEDTADAYEEALLGAASAFTSALAAWEASSSFRVLISSTVAIATRRVPCLS